MATRQALHAYLSEESKAGWDRYSIDTGASASAMAEVLGKMFGDQYDDFTVEMFMEAFPQFLRKCRAVDGERRRRR